MVAAYAMSEDEREVKRREFLRVDTFILAEFNVVNLGREGLTPGEPMAAGRLSQKLSLREGAIVNIGAGGLMLLTNEYVPAGNFLSISFDLPNASVEKALGRVVREERNEEISMGYRYILAIEFAAMDERTRNEIIKYTFDTQRKQRGHSGQGGISKDL
ncbi:MAG: PilZ domain-containing protein [bacterium]